jgi:hypothetical protein
MRILWLQIIGIVLPLVSVNASMDESSFSEIQLRLYAKDHPQCSAHGKPWRALVPVTCLDKHPQGDIERPQGGLYDLALNAASARTHRNELLRILKEIDKTNCVAEHLKPIAYSTQQLTYLLNPMFFPRQLGSLYDFLSKIFQIPLFVAYRNQPSLLEEIKTGLIQTISVGNQCYRFLSQMLRIERAGNSPFSSQHHG